MADIETLLRLIPDKAAAQQALKVLRDTRKELKSLADTAKQTDVVTGRTAGQLVKNYKAAAAEARKLRLEEEKRAQASRQAIGDVSTTFGAGSSVLGGLGGGAGQEALGIVGDVTGLIEYLPQLQAAFGALSAPMLALTGLLAGLAAAVAFFNAQNEAASQSVKTLIATQEQFYRVIKTGTREQLQDAIDAQQIELDITRARVEENQRLLAQFENEVGGAGRALADALNLAGARTLREETQELEGQLRTQEFLLRRYENALENNATAANDATAAEESLAEARKKQIADLEVLLRNLQGLIDADVNSTLRARLQLENLTAEQAEKRIEQAKREIALTTAALQESGQSQENIDRLRSRISELSNEIDVFSDALPGLRIRDTLAAGAQALEDTLKLNAERGTALTEVEERLRDQTVSAAKDREKSIVDAQRDANKALIDAAKDRDQSFAENAREAGDQRVDIERDYQKQLRDIQRRFNRASTDAIAERDVLAFVQARQARDDELRDAKEARAEGLRDVSEQLQRQNALVVQRYNEQTVAVAERLAEQTRVANERYAEQVRAANDAAAKERAVIQQKYAQELAVIQQGVNAGLQATASFWSGAVALARNALASITSAAAPRNPVSSLIGRVLGFADGGTPPLNRPVLVGENGPELVSFQRQARVFSNSDSQRMSGGAPTIPITINGNSKQQIIEQVVSTLSAVLEKQGY